MKVLLQSLSHFAFFRNKEINALYVTLALIQFASGLAGIFVPIYFWKLGMPFWKILFFFLLESAFFILITLSLVSLIKKLIDKLLMLLSVPFLALFYLGLNFFTEAPFLFYLIPFLRSVSGFLFNVGYHVSFAGAADGDSLGREIGAMYLVSSLVTLSAPFLGGLIIAASGFKGVFTLSTLLLFLAVLPLFYFPKRILSPDISQKTIREYLLSKPILPFTVSGAGYAMETMVGLIVWPIFMFIALGSIQEFGGVMSMGLLAGAAITFLMGFLSDAGRRRKVISWSSVLGAIIWLSRLFYAAPLAVAASQIVGNTVSSSRLVGWSSQFYKIARAMPSSGSFILSRELLYHISRVPFLALLMLLSRYLSLNSFFLTTFVFAAVLTLFFIPANRVHTGSLGNAR